ncbi:class I adenylate-forming enzyme family protein [Haloarchaeobius sp. TZWWS8]|uniref:class I adenylate-forming enzyme family protein n=1 Tax=Haloarchaeobius sp. TZWWS8 TaxID=3446121 RepID=UPI003EB7EC09
MTGSPSGGEAPAARTTGPKTSPVDWPTRDLVTIRAETTPERTALVDAETGDTWTYRELDASVDQAVRDIGVPAGGRLGVLCDTRVEVAMLLFAAMRWGATLVPLNVRNTADELAKQAARADLDMLACEAETREMAETVAPAGCPVVDVAAMGTPATADGAESPQGRRPVSPAELTPDTDLLLLFTSGTTGRPKGVRLTVANLLASATASAFRLGVERGDRWLVCLPTYHMGGLAPFVRSALYGTATVVQREFDARETPAVMDRFDVTGVSLVPTILRRLLEAGWTAPTSLRFVLLGGAAAGHDLLEAALASGVPVFPTYGMTEAASQIATATPEQVADSPGTVGQPLVNTCVRVLSETGEPCDTGDPGELVVSGPTVTPGYLDDANTGAAFSDRGFHTGDVGYRDDDGLLWVTGRVDDRIVTGGENVDPSVVASTVRAHPDVSEAAVVGLPDEEWGERVAVLVVAASEELSAAALQEFCRDRLADFELPKTIAFAPELPRTVSGTVDREAVRARLRKER